MNVDRTAKNTNLLTWNHELWVIDHGASLYFHHSWHNWEEQAKKPFLLIKEHVLLPFATELDLVDVEIRKALTPDLINQIVSMIPDEWLENENSFSSKAENKEAYAKFLLTRIAYSENFIKDAQNAATLI